MQDNHLFLKAYIHHNLNTRLFKNDKQVIKILP